MLTLSQTLSYYKRKDVQKLILEHAKGKEIGVRFNESFGKRPDILQYENDIMESAKSGATSFHCSEESWSNPLRLNPGLRKNELDDLRSGWDLILDIDCPYWSISKLAAYVFIKSLKEHGIESVTVKFSGSKGFHIAVPYEAFPRSIVKLDEKDGKTKQIDIKNWFPDGPRKVAQYLLHYATTNLIEVSDDAKKIKFGKVSLDFDRLLKETGKKYEELLVTRCMTCERELNEEKFHRKTEYLCPNCETRIEDEDKRYVICPKCRKLMNKLESKKVTCECGSTKFKKKMDLTSIISLDTVLISSRHMYRMPYSLHEKTGLVSMPFDIKHILKFDKEEADQKKFKLYKFLDRENVKEGEATELFQKAFDHAPESLQKNKRGVVDRITKERKETTSSFVANQEAVPEDFFPPCIKKISAGLQDGKKRALLVLINFLSSCNWEHDKIEEYIMKWNSRNTPDQLRETYIKGQLRYHKQQAANNKDKMMPPNCDNRGYMIDTQFCNPDGLCRTIKNPVQYAKKRAWLANQNVPKKRARKEESINPDANYDKSY